MKRFGVRYFVFFAVLLCSCTHLFYQGDHGIYYAPKLVNLAEKDIYFKNSKGKNLHGWHFKSSTISTKGLVILFHGNAENISSHFLNLGWLGESGYDLFVFDYQGFGKSEGESSQENTYFDGLAALKQGYELFNTEVIGKNLTSKSHLGKEGAYIPKFIVFGQSLGGAIASRALLDFPELSKVSLLVMESSFVSYQDISRRKLASHWLTWILSPLAYVLVSDKYSSEDAINHLKVPVLVVHDKLDPVVPIETSEEFYEALPSPKEFWRLSRGLHCGGFLPDEKENRKKLIQKFDSL